MRTLIEKLKDMYPLFDDIKLTHNGEYITFIKGYNASNHKTISIDYDSLNKRYSELLYDAEMKQRYPFLKIVKNNDKISAWVGDIGLNTEIESLNKLNYKAYHLINYGKDYFICSTCNQLLNKKDFDFNYFSGYYCKGCSNPELKKQAKGETYE